MAFSFLLPGFASVIGSAMEACRSRITSTPQQLLWHCSILPIARSCSLPCLLFSIIQPHTRNYIAVLSPLLLFLVARVRWQQLLPVTLGTGNFSQPAKSHLMFLLGVVKTGFIKPYSILPFLTVHWRGNDWMVPGTHDQASQMPQHCAESHGQHKTEHELINSA